MSDWLRPRGVNLPTTNADMHLDTRRRTGQLEQRQDDPSALGERTIAMFWSGQVSSAPVRVGPVMVRQGRHFSQMVAALDVAGTTNTVVSILKGTTVMATLTVLAGSTRATPVDVDFSAIANLDRLFAQVTSAGTGAKGLFVGWRYD